MMEQLETASYLQGRSDGIAVLTMKIVGIDHDSYQPDDNGITRWVPPSEGLRRVMGAVTSCTAIGNVGRAMLRAADFEV